jgi:hypothetical protein
LIVFRHYLLHPFVYRYYIALMYCSVCRAPPLFSNVSHPYDPGGPSILTEYCVQLSIRLMTWYFASDLASELANPSDPCRTLRDRAWTLVRNFEARIDNMHIAPGLSYIITHKLHRADSDTICNYTPCVNTPLDHIECKWYISAVDVIEYNAKPK